MISAKESDLSREELEADIADNTLSNDLTCSLSAGKEYTCELVGFDDQLERDRKTWLVEVNGQDFDIIKRGL